MGKEKRLSNKKTDLTNMTTIKSSYWHVILNENDINDMKTKPAFVKQIKNQEKNIYHVNSSSIRMSQMKKWLPNSEIKISNPILMQETKAKHPSVEDEYIKFYDVGIPYILMQIYIVKEFDYLKKAYDKKKPLFSHHEKEEGETFKTWLKRER